jgi:orotidine-5'-phosphate decarboxylase
VKLQYSKGVYHISEWADITNAHAVPGDGIVRGLKEIGLPKGRGLLILAEMSSKGTLAKGEYTEEAIEMAQQHQDFCIGFIGMKRALTCKGVEIEQDFIYMTPGVALEATSDNLGQQYRTPHDVIAKSGSDVIIVGRGLYESSDPISSAKAYRKAGWDAYLERSK